MNPEEERHAAIRAELAAALGQTTAYREDDMDTTPTDAPTPSPRKAAIAAIRSHHRPLPYLTWADLPGAILDEADLSGAILDGADLTRALLTGADLTRALLTRALLTRADLTGADLTDADLTDADLTDALLDGAIGLDKAIRDDAASTVVSRADADPWAPDLAELAAASHAIYARLDAVRQAAEKRLHDEAGDVEVSAMDDPAYSAALDAWTAWETACVELRAALAAAAQVAVVATLVAGVTR